MQPLELEFSFQINIKVEPGKVLKPAPLQRVSEE
jgi:hypothetical protein